MKSHCFLQRNHGNLLIYNLISVLLCFSTMLPRFYFIFFFSKPAAFVLRTHVMKVVKTLDLKDKM